MSSLIKNDFWNLKNFVNDLILLVMWLYVPSVLIAVKKTSKSKPDESFDEIYSSDSDVSDVTDVSPLTSPRNVKTKQSDKDFVFRRGDEYDLSLKHSKKYARPPSGGKQNSGHVHKQSDDSINMRLLMDVLEMEHDKTQDQYDRQRKVLFASPEKQTYGKKNFSFSNDQADRIDKDNQRLVERIMRYSQRRESLENEQPRPIKPKKRKPVLTASAINRQREQRRIEQENLAMLKRLQTTSATKALRRDKLLNDYQGKLIGGQSVADAHKTYGNRSRPSSAYSRSQFSPNFSPNYSLLDFTDPPTVTLNGDGTKRRTRPSSATVHRPHTMVGARPFSAKRPQSAKFS